VYRQSYLGEKEEKEKEGSSKVLNLNRLRRSFNIIIPHAAKGMNKAFQARAAFRQSVKEGLKETFKCTGQ
jgi:chlorite dismutase